MSTRDDREEKKQLWRVQSRFYGCVAAPGDRVELVVHGRSFGAGTVLDWWPAGDRKYDSYRVEMDSGNVLFPVGMDLRRV